MSKRQRFITISLFLTLGLGVLSTLALELRLLSSIALSLLAALLTYLSIRKELNGIEYVTLLTPPFLLTLAFALIFYFFPNFNRTFIFFILSTYFGALYSSLLSGNIFSAAFSTSLLLLKPAQTAFLFISLNIYFLLVTHLAKTGWLFIAQLAISLALAYFLAFLNFWARSLNQSLKFSLKDAKQWSFLSSTTMFLSSWWLSFLKLEPFFRSLVLTATLNAILGVYLAKLNRQFNTRTLIEYLLIPAAALLFSLIVE